MSQIKGSPLGRAPDGVGWEGNKTGDLWIAPTDRRWNLLFCANGEHLIRHGFAAPLDVLFAKLDGCLQHCSPQGKAYEESDAPTATWYVRTIPKAPLCKGSSRRSRVRDCFLKSFYNPSVLLRNPPPLTQWRLMERAKTSRLCTFIFSFQSFWRSIRNFLQKVSYVGCGARPCKTPISRLRTLTFSFQSFWNS